MDGNETRYCMQCGSTLGLDCGEAEPDFNKYFCSQGCASKNVLGPRRRYPTPHNSISWTKDE